MVEGSCSIFGARASLLVFSLSSFKNYGFTSSLNAAKNMDYTKYKVENSYV